jgi:hypothetical protein
VAVGFVLIGRDLTTAALESLVPGGPERKLTVPGKIKIVLHFIGIALLIGGQGAWAEAGAWSLTAATVLTVILLGGLARTTFSGAKAAR